MKIKRKNKIISIVLSIFVFIISTYVASIYLLNGDTILVNFDIISVTNDYNKYSIKYSEVKAADYYKIVILNRLNKKVYETKTNDTEVLLELSNLEFDMDYEIMVYAYDKLGDFRSANKSYEFKYDIPTISNKNKITLSDKNYDLIIDGNLQDKDYEVIITKENVILKKEVIKDNKYTIDKKLFLDNPCILNVSVAYKDKIISSINLYYKENPISSINILSPHDDDILKYNDISLSFEGGDNASSYYLKIYEDNKLVKEKQISKKHVILSNELFSPGKKHKIKIEAKYGDYKQVGEVVFDVDLEEQLKPVYLSSNWKYVKAGSFIELASNNSENTKIYYTIDGSNPESKGILYEQPIKVEKNMTLKAFAREDKKVDSIIKSYEINIGTKKNLTVYLSPSNQSKNIGVSEVGYTNERDEMNDLTNYIEERLESNGVRVVRNNSSGNINLWLKESAYAGADLHLAVHSNASILHDTYGVETWIHSEDSQTLSLASKIQNGLIGIYPYKDLENANRGVKYANGALGECNDAYIPFGILVEIAHHDYKNDALWIMQNKKLIGYNIADSILEYYQIIE